jgi:colicin import membrane protein
MPTFLREHSPSVLFSLLLHGLFIAAVVYSAQISFTHVPSTLQPMPVSATVVDSDVLHAAARAQEEAAAKAAAQAQAAAAARAEQAAQAAAAQTEQREAEQRKVAEAKQAEDAKRATAAKEAADAARAAEAVKAADAQRALEAKRAVEAKQAAEEKQAALAKQAADAKRAAEAKKAAEERAKADREAELRRQIQDEEHASEVESGPLGDRYRLSLQNRITHAWIKPPSAHSGIDCRVEVTQVPGGDVTNARVTQCNGDAAVRQSIENAVYRASPLPDPPDPSLFHRVIVLEFKPND